MTPSSFREHTVERCNSTNTCGVLCTQSCMNVCMLWKIKTSDALREVNERECITVKLMCSGWRVEGEEEDHDRDGRTV